ncbi:isoprenyl transferase [Candidatus Marinamargulisbacteria bacterium SCGC AG-343-D04]|nr:isoprenyl transferase [Candidatus Marinamargulisbacteria bacterium SCGC AG-343-D04]
MPASSHPLHKENWSINDIEINKTPPHIAIIMDGNGRWAKSKKKPRTLGHKAGVESLKNTIKACLDLNIKYLSVYTFSKENWKRPEKETSFLMNLLSLAIKQETKNLIEKNVKVKMIGDIASLDKKTIKTIASIEEKTKTFNNLQLNIMINYGSRQEILHCIQEILKDKNITPESLSEKCIEKHLYTSTIPDPDILIRSGGESRISNFLLWQLSYTELFFIDTLWPDFSEQDLINIVASYQNRHRRFGGL